MGEADVVMICPLTQSRTTLLAAAFAFATSTSGCGGRTDLGGTSQADAGPAPCQPIGQTFVVKDASTECSEYVQCVRDSGYQYIVDCSCATKTCTCSRVLAFEKPELLKTFSVTSCPCTTGLPPPQVLDPSVIKACGLSL